MKASTTSSAVSLIRACWIAAAVTAANDTAAAASASEKETTRPSSVSLLRHWMQPRTDFSSPDSSTTGTQSSERVRYPVLRSNAWLNRASS